MSFSRHTHLLEPTSIIIDREKRQRKIFTTDDLKQSIGARGQMTPIIVKQEDRGIVLIAGERRLTTFLENPEFGPVVVIFAEDLSEVETLIIELEENVKRQDLTWQERCLATLSIHQAYTSLDPQWTLTKTGEEMGEAYSAIYRMTVVAEEILKGNEKLEECSGWSTAYQMLENQKARLKESADARLGAFIAESTAPATSPAAPLSEALGFDPHEGAKVEGETPIQSPSVPAAKASPILLTDAIQWMKDYRGIPFNFLHCDFPYGINIQDSDQANAAEHGTYEDSPEIYWELLSTLCSNLNRIMSPQAHMIFWHSPKMIGETRDFFEKFAPDLWVQDVPLVWLKSDNRGIIADVQRRPRNITEFAFLITRGDRKLLEAVSNGYAAPTSREIHQSEKPIPVLKHFFRMIVDENTRMLDPTSGSGNALIAADDMGAGQVLGLEKVPDYHERSSRAFQKYRALKALSEGV